MNDSSYVFEIIHSTMQNSNNPFTVKELCSIASVSRSGYYAWIKAAPVREQQELQERADFELILAAYKMHGYTKGARGIYMAFRFTQKQSSILTREVIIPATVLSIYFIAKVSDSLCLDAVIAGIMLHRRVSLFI